MTRDSIGLPEPLLRYIQDTGYRESEILARLRLETAELPMARMQIAPEQGAFMGLLVELTGARRILEIGTFTGYSSLVMAMAMGPEGRLLTCDLSEDYTAMARRYWDEAGVSARIELRLAPALETLAVLAGDRAKAGDRAAFDLAFIDADKRGYGAYYERVLGLVRPGGLILIDNVLWSGRVADPDVVDAETEAIRALNRSLLTDNRISLALVPIGDGLTLVRKRG